MMSDEYAEIYIAEQFTFCIRTVDDNFEIKKDLEITK